MEILQKRKISYAGQVYEPGDTCYYLTMNPEFSATYPLDEALLDRISVCVPAFQPNFLAGLALSERERDVGELAEELPRFTLQEFDSLPGLVALVGGAGAFRLAARVPPAARRGALLALAGRGRPGRAHGAARP